MANINLYELYQNKRRKHGVNDSSRYRGAFVEAVNNAFAVFNAEVFQADTLEYIRDFNDIISQRMVSFSDIIFDDGENLLAAMSGREYWAVEYHLERKNTTNTFQDKITDGVTDIKVVISDDVLTLSGDAVSLDFELPSDTDSFRILVSSGSSGIRVLVDSNDATYTTDETISLDSVPDIDWVPDVEIIPSLGDTSTTQPLPASLTARSINNVSGFELISTAFYSSKTKLFEFLLNEATGTTVNSISYMGATSGEGYSATLTSPVWITTYVEDSCGLDQKYYPYFDAIFEYQLQQGGEWAIEPDLPLEARAERNTRKARLKNATDATYTGYLGSL